MHTLYTLGYTGLKPEQILKAAEDLGALVVDTRFSPRSRAPQWTRKQLSELLRTRYQHHPGLGNINYKGDGPIVISNPAFSVPQVALNLKNRPVILLCVCKDHHTCHRSVVADLVREHCGCEIKHLSAKDLPSLIRAEPLALTAKLLPLHQLKMF